MTQKVAESFEFMRDGVERSLWDTHRFNEFYVVNTFPDSVIVKDLDERKFFEIPYTIEGSEVVLGEPTEVEEIYVSKRLTDQGIDPASKMMSRSCELTGPIVMKSSDERRLTYAAVLVPDEIDHDGESVTKEKIEQAAHEWMKSYRNIDLQHSLNNIAVPVESYILPFEMATPKGTLPAGTWILVSKVLDDATWEAVKSGALSGYSVMGIKRSSVGGAIKSDTALKKTLLRDLGEDWVAVAVSIVDEPAVPAAKFFAIKSHNKTTEQITLAQRIRNMVMPAEKSGRQISERNYTKLSEIYKSLKEILEAAEGERADKNLKEEGLTMEMKEIKEMITEAVKSAVDPIKAEIEALKSNEVKQPEEPVAAEKSVEPERDVIAELDQLKETLSERFDKVEKSLAKRVTAKGLSSQDASEESGRAIKGRDSFGRRVRGDTK